MAGNKVQVNGNTNGNDPSVQTKINQALLRNGGVKRIQDTLQQRLDEQGWSQNLREYVERLFRSGEAVTYDDAWKKVHEQIAKGGEGLSIPVEAQEGGADAIKKELGKVCGLDKNLNRELNETNRPSQPIERRRESKEDEFKRIAANAETKVTASASSPSSDSSTPRRSGRQPQPKILD